MVLTDGRKGFTSLEDPQTHDAEEQRGFPLLRNDTGECGKSMTWRMMSCV